MKNIPNIHMSIKLEGRGKAAFFGWMVGNSLGVTNELYTKTDATNNTLKNKNFINGLVGGGVFNYQPGQFSGSIELGLTIMNVLMTEGTYDQSKVASEYHLWYKSAPKDIGAVLSRTFRNETATAMINSARKENNASLDNEFLTRIPPLIIFYQKKERISMLHALKADLELTNSNPELIYISFSYGCILHAAIAGESKESVYNAGRLEFPRDSLAKIIYETVDNGRDTFIYQGTIFTYAEIHGQNFSFVGFPFWLTLRAIKTTNSYRDVMIHISNLGGDTDRNCCIVGSVIGAMYPSTIPSKWISSVENWFDPQRWLDYPISAPAYWKRWLSNKK